MARIGQLIYAPEVRDNVTAPLNAMAAAAERTGAAVERLDSRVRRSEASFTDAAGRLDAVERAANKVERATASVTRTMEAAERAARAEGVAQERLNQVLTAGAAQREAAALAAVRGLTAEQQAAALTRAGYANLATQVQATAAAQSNLGVRASQGLAAANDNAAASSGRFRAALGQAGFQVQDFATQVSMGQNALLAFGVQGSQLAGAFGPTGAIAGAALMIGVIAAQLLGMGENAAEAERRIRVAFDGIKAESEGVRDVIKEIGDLYKTAAERAHDLARAQREVLSQNVDLRLSNSIQMQDAAATRIPTLEREIAVLERRAQVEADLARRAGRGGLGAPVDQTTDTNSALFVARSQLNGLRAEMDLMQRRIGELNTARQRLANAGSDQGYGQYGPERPPEARARATERASDVEREYLQIMREAEGQVTRTLTEEERRAAILDRLSQMLASGAITGDQYVVAMEAQRRAASALAEQEQRRVSERAAAESQRQAARAAEQIERQNQQVTDSIVRYGADRFADMFSANSRGWAGMLDTFRSTFRSLMARIAAEAIIRPIIAPIVQSLGLGQLGIGGSGGLNLGSIFGGGGGAAADLGSTQGAINQAGQSAGLFSFGRSTGIGNAFTGGTSNSGIGWLDAGLNTQLAAPFSFPSEAGFQAVVDGTAASGLSVGGALGGAAGIAGGAYGIYSGLQRGGIGGYTSAAGGALGVASGISSILASLGVISAGLGPIGWIGAAVLAIAGALLPGQKPSSMGQEARLELNSGALSTRGLTGDRYSQANATQAEAAVRSISDLASRLSTALGGLSLGDQAAAVGVTRNTLYLDAVGQKAQFANSEEGAKQLADTAARFLIDAFTEAEKRVVAARGAAGSDQLGILINSGGNVEALQQNLQWYEGTFKALTQTAEKTTEWARALASTAAPFDAAIEKARQLGVMEDALTTKRTEALVKLEAERNTRIGQMDNSLTARWFRAVGMNQNADMLAFDAGAAEEIRQTREALEQMGLSADQVAGKIARTEQVLAAERLSIVQRYAEESAQTERQAAEAAARAAQEAAQARQAGASGALGVVTSLRDYAASLGSTNAGANTALDRFRASQRQFDAIFGAARAGDATSLTGLRDAAETFRLNAREIYGGGAGYADAVRVISDRIGSIANLGPEALTQSFIAENARANTDRVVDALADLRAENAALRRDINMLMMRPVAA